MRILSLIENVEAMCGIVASYDVTLILEIPRECSYAIGFKAMSYRQIDFAESY